MVTKVEIRQVRGAIMKKYVMMQIHSMTKEQGLNRAKDGMTKIN